VLLLTLAGSVALLSFPKLRSVLAIKYSYI
jgi:hypothetical protein